MSARVKSYTVTKACCYAGYVCQAVCINLLPMLFIMFVENYGIGYEKLGRLVLVCFAVQLLADFLAMRLIDRIGYRRMVVFSHIMVLAGLLLLSLAALYPGDIYLMLVAAVSVYSLGAGIIEVAISPIVEYMPSKNKAAEMSMLHSAYSWGQVAVVGLTVLLWSVLRIPWYILPLLWAIVPFLNMFGFLSAPMPEIPRGGEEKGKGGLLAAPRFLLALALMVCGGAAEQIMAQWVSLFAESGLHISKTAGDLFGLCLFGALMGTGRLLYGFCKLPLRRTMLVCAVGCVACYLTASLAQNSLVALAACALCGLSVSLMWPGTYSLTARDFPSGGTAMFAMLAIAGDVGCSAGPWLTGLISDRLVPKFGNAIALKAGIFTGTVFAVIAVILLLRFKKRCNLGPDSVK